MATRQGKAKRPVEKTTGAQYRGKQTRTGNSFGFRFDRALFKSHPEFAGEVRAQVIAPGRMLVSVAEPVVGRADPVMAAFLAFLAGDIAHAPATVQPMSRDLAQRIDLLVDGVAGALDEPLDGESLL